ncbi:hypothetical protein QY895_03735 [Latilactobacillus sakei]
MAKKIKYYPVLVKQMDGKGKIDLEVGGIQNYLSNRSRNRLNN